MCPAVAAASRPMGGFVHGDVWALSLR